MSEETKTFTYKVEDIFEDIPGDSENLNMTIPPEIAEKAGLNPGDPIRILWGDQGTIIIEKIKDESGQEKQETDT